MHRRNYFRKRYNKLALNATVMICRACHNGIHVLYDEKTLALRFNTLQDLRDDPAIARHVAWVAKRRLALARVG